MAMVTVKQDYEMVTPDNMTQEQVVKWETTIRFLLPGFGRADHLEPDVERFQELSQHLHIE